MKKVILILTLIIISVCGFGQSLNVEPYGKSIIDYKRIGNTIYLEYRKFIDNAGYLVYPENYSGTIYYVSSDGSDSNDGSKTSPFATITKVNTLTLSGDDAVLFESSGSYNGQITVGQSGTLEHPITIGAYGNVSSKPKIYGSELITGWTLHSGNIWKATVNIDSYKATSSSTISVENGYHVLTIETGKPYFIGMPLLVKYDETNFMNSRVMSYDTGTGELEIYTTSSVGSGAYSSWTLNSGEPVRGVYVDDELVQLARLPKIGTYTPTTVTSQSVFACSTLDGGIDYTGAIIQIQSADWQMDKRNVLSSSSTTLTINRNPTYTIGTSNKFVIMNKLDFLTQENEWYYDDVDNTLYVWLPNNANPTEHSIRVSAMDEKMYGINIQSGSDYVSIKNIEFKNQAAAGVYVHSAHYSTVENCDINNSDGYGILYNTFISANSPTYSLAKNNTISKTNFGIGGRSHNSTVEYNTISNIFLSENYALNSYSAGGNAISMINTGGVYRYNNISNIGYNGIRFDGVGSTVEYNYIEDICKTLEDGGAIYTFTIAYSAISDWDNLPVGSMNSTINNNIVVDNRDYSNNLNTLPKYGGLYLDEGSHDITMENNLSYRFPYGISLNKTAGRNTIQNNMFVGGALVLYNNQSHFENTIANNVFKTLPRIWTMPNLTSPWWSNSYERMIYERPNTVAVYDTNLYVSRFATNVFVDSAFNTEAFAAWQTGEGDDESTYIGTALSTGEDEKVFYNPMATTKTYYLNNATGVINTVTGDTISAAYFSLDPFTSIILRGLNLDCIQEYSDAIAPAITAFTLPDTSETLVVTPTTLTVAGDATAYKLTETYTEPTLESDGWSITPSYTFTLNGKKTLYAWARDTAGNISASTIDSIVINVSVDLTTDLIAVYDMQDSGTTLPDETANGLNGTHYASVTPITGNPGSGLTYSFAVNRHTAISDNIAFDFTGNFTIAAWVNPTSLSSNRALIAKSATGVGSVNEFEIFITTDGKVQVNAHENGTTEYISASTPISTIAIGNNYLIEVKMDNSDRVKTGLEISVNRVSQSLTYGGTISDLTSGILHTASNLYIGYAPRANYYGNEVISQICLFNRKISAIDSDYLYNSGSGIDYINW